MADLAPKPARHPPIVRWLFDRGRAALRGRASIGVAAHRAAAGRPAALAPPDLQYSPPAQHITGATPEDIFYCFRLLLDRCPNPEEWPGHSSYAGADLASVVGSFVNSREFAQRGLLNKTYLDSVKLIKLAGFSIFAAKDDLAIGARILDGHAHDPHIAAAFRRLVRPGMVVVDIGANIGSLTMLLATLVTPAGRVVAVEPNPDNVRLLEAGRRVNGFHQVAIIPVAAGRETGLLALNTSYSNGMTGDVPNDPEAILASRLVPSFALDAVLPADRPIDLIKIDVEGAELNAVIGLAKTIDRDRPVILSEFSPDTMPGISHCTGPEYVGHLIGKGYRIGIIEPDGSVSMFGEDVDGVMAAYARSGGDHIDIIATPK
jgi:FkbM family methyltransferase